MEFIKTKWFSLLGCVLISSCYALTATAQNAKPVAANFSGVQLAALAPVAYVPYYKHSYPIYAGRIYNPKYYYGRFYSPYNNKVYYPRYYTPRYRGERLYYPSYRTYYYRGGQYR